MSACEECWADAFTWSKLRGGSQVDNYLLLLSQGDHLDGHNDPEPTP